MTRPKYLPDNFSLLIMLMVVVASILPIAGQYAVIFSHLTDFAIALMFFLHGAKLSREAVIEGITHWRLHAMIFASTFVLYPILGLLIKPLITPLVGHELSLGFLYLCLLPSTVQSSIAFVSVAKGNVAGAVCSASASNIIGIFLTPLLVGLFLSQNLYANSVANEVGLGVMLKIIFLLLVPFVLGQLARNTMKNFLKNNAKIVKMVDQGSILMVVYSAFSAAVIEGIWRQVSWQVLAYLIVICMVLLFMVMVLLHFSGKKLGFNHTDQITILFCGSKKTLASGVPMAKILFAGQPYGLLILPLMLFHQIQLIVCGILASRFANDSLGHNKNDA